MPNMSNMVCEVTTDQGTGMGCFIDLDRGYILTSYHLLGAISLTYRSIEDSLRSIEAIKSEEISSLKEIILTYLSANGFKDQSFYESLAGILYLSGYIDLECRPTIKAIETASPESIDLSFDNISGNPVPISVGRISCVATIELSKKFNEDTNIKSLLLNTFKNSQVEKRDFTFLDSPISINFQDKQFECKLPLLYGGDLSTTPQNYIKRCASFDAVIIEICDFSNIKDSGFSTAETPRFDLPLNKIQKDTQGLCFLEKDPVTIETIYEHSDEPKKTLTIDYPMSYGYSGAPVFLETDGAKDIFFVGITTSALIGEDVSEFLSKGKVISFNMQDMFQIPTVCPVLQDEIEKHFYEVLLKRDAISSGKDFVLSRIKADQEVKTETLYKIKSGNIVQYLNDQGFICQKTKDSLMTASSQYEITGTITVNGNDLKKHFEKKRIPNIGFQHSPDQKNNDNLSSLFYCTRLFSLGRLKNNQYQFFIDATPIKNTWLTRKFLLDHIGGDNAKDFDKKAKANAERRAKESGKDTFKSTLIYGDNMAELSAEIEKNQPFYTTTFAAIQNVEKTHDLIHKVFFRTKQPYKLSTYEGVNRLGKEKRSHFFFSLATATNGKHYMHHLEDTEIPQVVGQKTIEITSDNDEKNTIYYTTIPGWKG